MGIVLGVIWVLAVLTLLIGLLGFAATIPLMQRRKPDAYDHPIFHQLTTHEVALTTRDGLTLEGWWIPAQDTGQDTTRGTVIFCPGQNGSMDSDIPQAQPLHDAGFNVLMFDWRAHGRSEGETVTMGALEQLDLQAAIDCAQQEYGIDRVGVMGFSLGAGVSLLTAAYDSRIAALVVDGAYPRLDGILAGWARRQGFPGPLARGFGRLIVFAASMRSNLQLYRANPIDVVSHISAPTLFVHGMQDNFVTAAEFDALHTAMTCESDVWRVPDANHREAFTLHTQEYSERVVDWFTRSLSDHNGNQTDD